MGDFDGRIVVSRGVDPKSLPNIEGVTWIHQQNAVEMNLSDLFKT